jgi:nitrile hydratase
MDGVHDVGGMDGFGPVDTTEHEDTFHERWEGVTYAAFLAGLGSGTFGIDEFRHSIERLAPAEYLTASYYDRWVRGISRLFVEKGVIDADALRERTAAIEAGEATVPDREDPDLLGELAAGVTEAYDASGDGDQPRFAAGDRVVVRNHNPAGHTRCPGYVRRAQGEVRTCRGHHSLPDAAAHGKARSEPLYNVRFQPEELWGERADRATAVSVDLWESYLRPAES